MFPRNEVLGGSSPIRHQALSSLRHSQTKTSPSSPYSRSHQTTTSSSTPLPRNKKLFISSFYTQAPIARCIERIRCANRAPQRRRRFRIPLLRFRQRKLADFSGKPILVSYSVYVIIKGPWSIKAELRPTDPSSIHTLDPSIGVCDRTTRDIPAHILA